MIKKHLKTLIITSIIILLPIAAGLLLWDQLPEQIPSHWNINGEVDGWSSKGFAVFALPLILLGAQWLCCFVTGADPKKANHSEKVYQLVFWIMPVLSVVLFVLTYGTALGKAMPVEMIMPILMGLLFVVLGNYMPKCKQNYTIGIKISWTLNSEENWNRTHRFAGRVWVVGGIAILLTAFLGNFWIFFGITMVMASVPVVYSYLLHRKGI